MQNIYKKRPPHRSWYDSEVVMEIKSAGMQALAKEAYNENQD